MSAPDDYDLLRSALLAAADSIEPGPEGLERIQARLRQPRPLPIAWLQTTWTRLALRIPDQVWAVPYRLADWLREGWRQLSGALSSGRRPRLGWARPALLTAAVILMGVGTYVAIAVQEPAAPANSNLPNSPHRAKPGNTGQPGSGASASSSAGPSGLGSAPSPSSTTSCKPARTTHSAPAGSGSPTTSPSSTPSPSSSTASPSPSAPATTSPPAPTSSPPSPSTSTGSSGGSGGTSATGSTGPDDGTDGVPVADPSAATSVGVDGSLPMSVLLRHDTPGVPGSCGKRATSTADAASRSLPSAQLEVQAAAPVLADARN